MTQSGGKTLDSTRTAELEDYGTSSTACREYLRYCHPVMGAQAEVSMLSVGKSSCTALMNVELPGLTPCICWI